MTDDLLAWERPVRCNATGNCVEVAAAADRIALRNSGESETVVRYTRSEFAAFVDAVKAGQYDHLV